MRKFGSLVAAFLFTASLAFAGAQQSGDDDYDRLDGKGESGKKVNVIEWEGNLEIHVYPAGSLKGLALKLDKKNKDKPVMVIGYRFDGDPTKQVIRRNILGIDLREGFKAYKDPTSLEYYKIIISNNGLASPMLAMKLDAEPSQLYPDGHPALAPSTYAKKEEAPTRMPAQEPKRRPDQPNVDDEGTISPYTFR